MRNYRKTNTDKNRRKKIKKRKIKKDIIQESQKVQEKPDESI